MSIFFAGDIMGHHGNWPRRLLRLWQQYEAVGIEITVHHPDDVGMTEWEITLPSQAWRWVCWLQGHRPYDARIPQDNYCLICKKILEERPSDTLRK